MTEKRQDNPAKTFLRRYRAILQRQRSLQRTLKNIRDSQTDIAAKLGAVRVQGGSPDDRQANDIARICTLEELIADAEKQAAAALRDILDAIDAVPDEKQKTVLTMRYVEGLPWPEIADRLHYEKTQVFLFHGLALKNINQWLKVRSKTEY